MDEKEKEIFESSVNDKVAILNSMVGKVSNQEVVDEYARMLKDSKYGLSIGYDPPSRKFCQVNLDLKNPAKNKELYLDLLKKTVDFYNEKKENLPAVWVHTLAFRALQKHPWRVYTENGELFGYNPVVEEYQVMQEDLFEFLIDKAALKQDKEAKEEFPEKAKAICESLLFKKYNEEAKAKKPENFNPEETEVDVVKILPWVMERLTIFNGVAWQPKRVVEYPAPLTDDKFVKDCNWCIKFNWETFQFEPTFPMDALVDQLALQYKELYRMPHGAPDSDNLKTMNVILKNAFNVKGFAWHANMKFVDPEGGNAELVPGLVFPLDLIVTFPSEEDYKQALYKQALKKMKKAQKEWNEKMVPKREFRKEFKEKQPNVEKFNKRLNERTKLLRRKWAARKKIWDREKKYVLAQQSLLSQL